MAKQPVEINGQRIGRLRASWLLFKETWRFLQSDKEMIWIPLISGLANLLLFGVLVGIFVVIVLSTGTDWVEEQGDVLGYVFLFGCYVVGAFCLAVAEAAIAHTVYTRLHGGNASLGGALRAAFGRWGTLFLWSLITSTVGLLLRMIAERSKLLGKIVALVLGVAWSVLTYFVVPTIMIQHESAFTSIKTSGRVFRQTWGETLVSNITLGLTFFIFYVLLFLATIGLSVTFVAMELWPLAVVIVVLMVLAVIVLSLIQSAMNGILKTILFVYATEATIPPNFNQELINQMLVRQGGTGVPPSTPVTPAETPNQPQSFTSSQTHYE